MLNIRINQGPDHNVQTSGHDLICSYEKSHHFHIWKAVYFEWQAKLLKQYFSMLYTLTAFPTNYVNYVTVNNSAAFMGDHTWKTGLFFQKHQFSLFVIA